MDNVQEIFKNLILKSISTNVSDIYFMPKENKYQVIAKNAYSSENLELLDTQIAQKLISYLKYLANLDITEKRRPQSGQFELDDVENVFMRIATVGDFQQKEVLVCRLIYSNFTSKNNFIYKQQFEKLKKMVLKPGLHVLAGPMGSGKTTTAFALAQSLVEQNKIVLTIEDPVEVKNNNFVQLQVNGVANMDYEQLIKSGLRQRPDVFLIGEIRDKKTAIATINAALSGHIVISTVHAKSVKGVLPRLKELGVEEEYLKSSLESIAFQRLLPCINGNLAALQDQLFGDEIWQNLTSKWEENIKNAFDEKFIDKETWKTYSEIKY